MRARTLIAGAFVAGALAVSGVVALWVALAPRPSPPSVTRASPATVPAADSRMGVALPEETDDDERAEGGASPLPEGEEDVIPPTDEGGDAEHGGVFGGAGDAVTERHRALHASP